MRRELYLADLLEPVFKLFPQGQKIISLVQVRDFVVITTDEAVYRMDGEDSGFSILRINMI